MLVKLYSSGIDGIDAFTVEVEVDVRRASMMPAFTLVGLPGAGVKESKDRVDVALRNSGYALSRSLVTVNLAPADRRKEGSAFELPIGIGLLAASELLASDRLGRYVIVGELGLDGSVRPVCGCLSIAIEARARGFEGLLCPRANANEAAVVAGLRVVPVDTLNDAVEFLAGRKEIAPVAIDVASVFDRASRYPVDFSEVRGQYSVKRAMTVAAAGGHNVLLIGPPGAGKSMIAQRLPTILPELTLDESLETTRIYSVAGMLEAGQALMATRPFRSPHHSVSSAGLIGGGASPRPGEISLAHHGVLFLDELPEFTRVTLEALRQPMEDGRVTIARAQTAATYPAAFMLVAAMNPCPCAAEVKRGQACRCTRRQVLAYQGRISGPFLDRIDIQVHVPAVEYQDLASKSPGESSEAIRQRVKAARQIQLERFGGDHLGDRVYCNARMRPRQVTKYCEPDADGERLLKHAIEQLGFSARAYGRILKVARTIADLDGSQPVRAEHVSEAIQYRSLDRKDWG